MTLKETRNEYGLSQLEASKISNIPIRTYRRYENDESYGNSLKRKMIIELLDDSCAITENKGILTIETIKEKLTTLFENTYKGEIDFCYLFGSYAKGLAKEDSDVDLYVSSSLTGFRLAGLMERIREMLHKRVDVIRSSELNNNIDLVNEIMKGGIKIYG